MSIMHMSISGGILVAAIVVIRAVTLDKLPKKMFLALWSVALCRLLIPVSIPSRFSVYNIINRVINRISPDTSISVIDIILPFDGMKAGMAGQFMLTTPEQIISITPTTIIWITGMLSMFIFFVVVHFKNHKELRFALLIRNHDFLNEWLAEHSIFRSIAIMQSDRITTPVAVGMVKPRIILPKSMNMDDKPLLQYVLTHEYYHIRRFDTLWKLLIACALCIHWFNPMVWVMLILVNRDLELTCDEMVIHHFGTDTKTAYAYSLIGMAEQRNKFAPLYNDFSKNAVEERIVSIMKMKKTSLFGIILAFVVVSGTTTVFATSGSALEADIGYAADCASVGIDFDFQSILSDYSKFGLTSNGKNYYYKDQLVRFFVDNRSGIAGKFSGTVMDLDTGVYYLEAKRDSKNQLIAIEEITPERADEISTWRP